MPSIRRRLQHGDPLPPQRRLAGELAPLLLPGGIGVQGEDQRADLAHPVPALALHAEDRHHARDARGHQRQRVKGAFAHPQRAIACLQRGGVEVALDAGQVIVALRLGHLLCCANCRRIAYAQLRRQRQRNAALLQVGVAAAARQGSVERCEPLGEVGPQRNRRTW